MSFRLAVWPVLYLGATLGCRGLPEGTMTLEGAHPPASPRRDEAPVPLNAESPVEYPTALAQQRIGGTVILRLVLTETGSVVPESTAIQESSGYPALDSAALAAVPLLRYAPALHEGRPLATAFLQPFIFRPPAGGGTPP